MNIPYDNAEWRAVVDANRRLLMDILKDLARVGQAAAVQPAVAQVNAYLRTWDERKFDDFGAWWTALWEAQAATTEAVDKYLAVAESRKAVQS